MRQNTSEAIPLTIGRVRLALGSTFRVHIRFLTIFARWLSHWMGFKWRYKSKTAFRFSLYLAMILVSLPVPGLGVAGCTFSIIGEEYAMSVCALLMDLFLAASMTIFLFCFWIRFVLRLGRRFRCLTFLWSTVFTSILLVAPFRLLGEWHKMHQLMSRAEDIDRKLKQFYQLERRSMSERLYQLPNCGDSQPGQPYSP